MRSNKYQNKIKKLFTTSIILIVLCIVIRIGLGEICLVPTPSMEPTILPGDFVWINKITFGTRLPKCWSDIPIVNIFTWNKILREKDSQNDWGYHRIKGLRPPTLSDIIVFNSPENPHILLVKRITNIISSGDTIILNQKNYEMLKKILDNEYISVYCRQNNIYINGKKDSCYQVKQNYYFVIGDNSTNSHDSRMFGYIPEKAIIGKVDRILFSMDFTKTGFYKFRWNRFLDRLH